MGTIGTIIFLIFAGILAGVVSAVASMASLVSYPALLIAGAPPVMANITNTAALSTIAGNNLDYNIKASARDFGYFKETQGVGIFKDWEF